MDYHSWNRGYIEGLSSNDEPFIPPPGYSIAYFSFFVASIITFLVALFAKPDLEIAFIPFFISTGAYLFIHRYGYIFIWIRILLPMWLLMLYLPLYGDFHGTILKFFDSPLDFILNFFIE